MPLLQLAVFLTTASLFLVGCEDPTEPLGDSGARDTNTASDGTPPGEPRCPSVLSPPGSVAVFLGRDGLDALLIEMCFAETGDLGQLVPGTERFDIYITPDPGLHPGLAEYPRVSDAVVNLTTLQQYDVILIGATTDTEAVRDSLFDESNASLANLRAYVEGGGNIISSEEIFVEWVFPEVIDFQGSNEIPIDTAEGTGTGIRNGSVDVLRNPEIVSVDLLDGTLASRLTERECGLALTTSTEPCLDANGRLPVRLHNGFPVIIGGHGAGVTSLIEAKISYIATALGGTEQAVRPLLVEFQAGSGRVALSSVWFSYGGVETANGQLFQYLFDRYLE